MGTNTGIGIGIGIPFKNNALGGDRPYLPPELKARLIGVWDNYGKKNTDADRNIIKNKIPNAGGDLEIINAAYRLNSGFGGYTNDFQEYPYNENVIVKDNTNAIFNSGGQLLLPYPLMTKDVPSFKIKVSGLSETYHFRYYYRDGNGIQHSVDMAKDGNYELPICYNVQNSSDGTNCGFANNGNDIITVEILPEFEGAFVTDGIDDLITSTKTVQEMGITDEVTVVSMIHQIDLNSTYTIATTNYIENSNSREHVRSDVYNYGKTGIYGYSASLINNTKSDIKNILGDEADYYVKSTNSLQTIFDAKFSVVGRISELTEASQVAWYWTIIANKVLTTDQINQVIAYFNLDRTLNPDILCNTIKQGITNENHAEFGDKLIDFSGNGRDIQLNNIAWKGDSGIGKYEVDFLDSSIWNSSNSTITSSKIDCKNAISHIMLLYYSVGSKERPDIPSFKVIKTGADIDYSYIDETGSPKSVKIVDGVNILPASHNTLYSGSGRFCGFGNPGMGNSVTITQIPSHAGGLCLDGINDFGKVTGMPVYKDYTVIADYIRISAKENAQDSPILSKSKVAGSGAFLFNYLNADSVTSSFSFGTHNALKEINDFERKIYYLSKYASDGYNINAGYAVDYDTMWLGAYRDNAQNFFNGAIYSLMSFPYSMSEFLIERQLKKYKLGTLYPNMVEFRPIIKANDNYKIFYTAMLPLTGDIWERINIGDYVPVGRRIAIQMSFDNEAKKLVSAVSSQLGNITIVKNSNNIGYTIFGDVLKDKSPQKISITIEQDENYILFNPVINSNYDNYKLTFHLREYEKLINIGDYIPKGTYIRANLYLKNNIDELVTFTFNGVNIDYVKSSVSDLAYNIRQIYNYDSPQEVNITIDEYIRYEDIVQPYPLFFEFTDENGNLISWGGKAKVGSTITRTKGVDYANLLEGLFTITNPRLNGVPLSSSQHVVEKSMVFTCTATWAFDNNEPKCILSPRLLSIPNSSYKILGYIPDISGHGNHGVIHNSAYAEGSGVNEDGSYQFDGVDDFITIPTTVGGKQVLMKVNWQSIAGTAILYDQRTNGGFAIFNRDFDTNENKVPAYRARNIGGSTYIDGILNKYIYASELKNITHNIVELHDPKLNIGTLNPKIGSSFLNSNYTQMSLYDFMLFDEISTEAKIKELNTYIGITPKVTLPNYYWDNYGKKNTDANRGHVDEQVSLQKTGTSVNPLENFNISYEGMSGYNGYPVVFGASKTWESLSDVYGYTSDVTNTTIHVTHAEHAGTGLLFSYVKKDGALANIKEIPAFRVTIGGLEGNSKFGYRYLATEDATEETLVYLGNGTHELAKSFAPTEVLLDLTRNVWVGIFITPMIEGEVVFDCDITIEVLPEYENGLAYDGVSDFSQNTEIEVVEDFTFLVKGSLLKGLTGSGGCIARKGDKKHYDTGGYAFIYCFDSPIESYRNSYYSFGKSFVPSKEIVAPPLIGYMTKTNVNGETTTFGTNSDIKGIIFGNWSSGYMNMVIYKSIFYTKTISLLEINFLKNLMEKDEIIDINHPIFISNTEDESNTSQDT